MAESRMTHLKAVTGALVAGPVFRGIANTTSASSGITLSANEFTTSAHVSVWLAPTRLKLEKLVVMRPSGNASTTSLLNIVITAQNAAGTTNLAINTYQQNSILRGAVGNEQTIIDEAASGLTKTQHANYTKRPHWIVEAGCPVVISAVFSKATKIRHKFCVQPYFREWTGVEETDPQSGAWEGATAPSQFKEFR